MPSNNNNNLDKDLLDAFIEGNLENVQKALDKGANPHLYAKSEDVEKYLPCSISRSSNIMPLVVLSILNGNAKNYSPCRNSESGAISLVALAMLNGNAAIVEKLLRRGANVDEGMMIDFLSCMYNLYPEFYQDFKHIEEMSTLRDKYREVTCTLLKQGNFISYASYALRSYDYKIVKPYLDANGSEALIYHRDLDSYNLAVITGGSPERTMRIKHELFEGVRKALEGDNDNLRETAENSIKAMYERRSKFPYIPEWIIKKAEELLNKDKQQPSTNFQASSFTSKDAYNALGPC